MIFDIIEKREVFSIKKLIASFLLFVSVINTAYAEKIIFNASGVPVKQIPTPTPVSTEVVVQQTNTVQPDVVKVPEQQQTPDIKQINVNNYKPDGITITKAQAITEYYDGVYAENSPKIVKTYDIVKKYSKIDYYDIQQILEHSEDYPDSFYKACELGIVPDYISATHSLCKNQHLLQSLNEIYTLFKNNNFSEKEMRNLVYFYKENCSSDKVAVPTQDIESIINNNSIPQNDKFYYIYAKLAAKHYDNPLIESDIINSYELLKQNPEIIKSGYDTSILNDKALRILNYRPNETKTEETIRKTLELKNLSDREKYYRILGCLNVYGLKEGYPDTLYKIAEEGIMYLGFNSEDAQKYYNDENVLNDVLKASQILMKNKYYNWKKESNVDIFAIAPELCITSRIVEEVVNDKKIPFDKKEETIVKRLYKEKFLDKDNNTLSEKYKTSELGYIAIEKGYYPTYIDNKYDILEKSSEEKLKIRVNPLEMMLSNGFSENNIKTLYKLQYSINLDNQQFLDIITKVVQDKTILQEDKPNKVLREMLMSTDHTEQWKENVDILLNSKIVNIDNIILSDFYDMNGVSKNNIEALISLNNITGFKESDISMFIYNCHYLQYLDDTLTKVLNDKTIEPEDRPAYLWAQMKIEYAKSQTPEDTETATAYLEAINSGVILYYPIYTGYNKSYYNNLTELYLLMRDKRNYTGKEIDEIMSLLYNCKYTYEEASLKAALKTIKKDECSASDVKKIINHITFMKSMKEELPWIIFCTIMFLITSPLLIVGIATIPLFIWMHS